MSLTAKFSLNMQMALANALDLGQAAKVDVNRTAEVSLLSGTGAGKVAKQYGPKELTLTTAQTVDLDFNAGGLLDNFGAALVFTVIRGMIFEFDAANTTLVTLQPKAGAALPFLTGTTPALSPFSAGDVYMQTRKDATGIAVTAGTGDTLSLVNAAGASAKVRVTVVGE